MRIHQRGRTKTKIATITNLLSILILMTGYCGSYIALSAHGGWYFSQTGKLRYDFGFAISDVERWFRAWAQWEPFRDVYGNDNSRGNVQGYLYSPLIRIDRAWVHPDRPIF